MHSYIYVNIQSYIQAYPTHTHTAAIHIHTYIHTHIHLYIHTGGMRDKHRDTYTHIRT